ncbi:hypothetical protein G7054_g3597 [Neopestalotiopsis clavispora]|nr:hypothetical protein G7054_g3597 [Neopestalotiopsis clavispora]
MSDQIYDVLIAGAGPVGLLLACELRLASKDISVLVLERDTDPSNTDTPWKKSPLGMRGINTLSAEALDRRGLLDQVIGEQMLSKRSFNFAESGFSGHFAGIMFDASKVDRSNPCWKYKLPGPGFSPSPSSLEMIVNATYGRAKELGVEILGGVDVTGATQDGEGVVVHTSDDEKKYRGRWLVGCDGGRSKIRKSAGFEFVGTDAELMGWTVLCDIDDPNNRLQRGFTRTPTGLYLKMIPGHIGTMEPVKAGVEFDRTKELTAEEFQVILRRVSGCDDVSVKSLQLASSYTDRAMQAKTYRKDRIFLAGDSAHIHAPLGGQGRQSLAVPQPDWVAQTLQGSRFASNGSSAVPRTAPQQQPQAKPETSPSARAERRSVGYRDSDSRRSSSAATVVPETYAPAVVPTTMSIVQNARSRSRASQSVMLGEDGDDMQSVYSARSAATTSYAPRNFSRPMEQKKQQQQQQNIVRAQGVEFELLNHLRSSNSRTATMESSSSRPSSFRALSVVIPPSQSAASSFSVRSVTRSTTPPLPTTDMAPSPARTTSTSSRESTVFSDATCTRSSTVSSTTTVSSSRSPSPAPSSYDPVPDKTIIPARVAQVSESRQHPWTVESRDTKTLRDPRRSVMPPVTSASGLASSSHRAVAMVADDRHRDEKTLAAVRMNRTQPPTHPNPLAYHPIELTAASSRQQQEKQKHTIVKPKPYLLREEATNVVEQHRAESPPAFDNDNSLQRSDSLFLPGGSKGSASSPSSSSRMRNPPPQHEFFPSWTQHQQARSQVKTADGVGIQPYRKLEGLGPVPQQQQQQAAVVVPRAADDRRMLPSQSSSHRTAGVALPHPSAYSLQRVAMTNAYQQVARVGGPAAATATRPMTSSRLLRKTTAIDFTRMRAEHGN